MITIATHQWLKQLSANCIKYSPPNRSSHIECSSVHLGVYISLLHTYWPIIFVLPYFAYNLKLFLRVVIHFCRIKKVLIYYKYIIYFFYNPGAPKIHSIGIKATSIKSVHVPDQRYGYFQVSLNTYCIIPNITYTEYALKLIHLYILTE